MAAAAAVAAAMAAAAAAAMAAEAAAGISDIVTKQQLGAALAVYARAQKLAQHLDFYAWRRLARCRKMAAKSVQRLDGSILAVAFGGWVSRVQMTRRHTALIARAAGRALAQVGRWAFEQWLGWADRRAWRCRVAGTVSCRLREAMLRAAFHWLWESVLASRTTTALAERAAGRAAGRRSGVAVAAAFDGWVLRKSAMSRASRAAAKWRRARLGGALWGWHAAAAASKVERALGSEAELAAARLARVQERGAATLRAKVLHRLAAGCWVRWHAHSTILRSKRIQDDLADSVGCSKPPPAVVAAL